MTGGQVELEPTLVLDGTDALAWAVYRLPVWWGDELNGITLDISGSSGAIFAGLSDWQRGSWNWQALAADAEGLAALVLPEQVLRTQPADHAAFLALAASDGGVLQVQECSLDITQHPPTGVSGAAATVGVPVQSLRAHGVLVYPTTGEQSVYTFCNGSGGPAFVTRFDPATGGSQTWPIPSSDETLYPGELGADGKLYTALSPSGEWFCFDPTAEETASLGAPEIAAWTYGMCAASDGYVYGTGYQGLELVRYNPADGSFATLVAELDSENTAARTLLEWNGALYIGLGSQNCGLLRYSLADGTLAQVLPEEYRGGGWADILALDHNTGQPVIRWRPADGSEHWLLMDAGHSITETSEDELDWAYGWLADGSQVWIDTLLNELRLVGTDGTETSVPFTCDRSSAHIYNLSNGQDGQIYGSTFPIFIFRLDPLAGWLEDLGNLTGADGQVYAMARHGDLLYMCAYPRGNLSVFDTTLPIALTEDGYASAEPGANPCSLGYLDDYQHRPVDMALAPDGMAYLAVIADYGGTTGSLSRYDPSNGSFTCYQPYAGEDFTGVATIRDVVYALTEERLLAWDTTAETSMWEYTPEPALTSTPTRLAIDRNGNLVWADSGSGGCIYIYNPLARELVGALSLTPERAVSPSWNCLDCGPDGNVCFITTGQASGTDMVYLNVLNSADYTITQLYGMERQVKLPVGFGWDGDTLYYGLGSAVYSLDLAR